VAPVRNAAHKNAAAIPGAAVPRLAMRFMQFSLHRLKTVSPEVMAAWKCCAVGGPMAAAL
jgi:hypothetical protein